MTRHLFNLSMASIVVLTLASAVSAQPDNDVAHWLERDETLLVRSRDVPTTYDRIKSLDLFSNPRFIKAITMLSDERFPVVDQDSCERILVSLYELEALVRKIEEISFAVHEIDEKAFHWSLFVRAEPDVLDQIQDRLRGIDSQLKKGDPPKESEQADTGAKAATAAEDSPDSDAVRWGQFRRADPWLILSNHAAFLDALPNRIDNEKFRSLAKSRKYQAINNRESPLNTRDGLITVYGNPVRMRYLVPHMTQEEWDLAEMDELPACGLNVVFTHADDGDQPQPIVLADAVVKFTKPAVGQAKIFEHYRAIEIPPLAVEPIELLAFARDEKAVAEETMRVYDQQHGPDAADTFWKNHFLQLGVDYLTEAAPRRSSFLEMRFVDEKSSPDRPGLLSMERLKDKEAGVRFAQKVANLANDTHQQGLERHADGAIALWTIPGERFNDNTGLKGFNRTRHLRNDFFNPWHDAYALTDQWWIQGDMPAVKGQVDLLTTDEGVDYSQPIRDLVDDLTHRLGLEDPPVMLKYYREDSWQENLNKVEQQYANSNLQPANFRISFVQGSGNTFRLEMEPDSKDGPKLGGGTMQLFINGSDEDSNEKSGDSAIKKLSNQQVLRVMMPMPLTERNEDGHRIALKKREDLEAAIRVMILKSITESFPRQLILYTRNDQHIRVIMGAYPVENLHKKD